MRTSLGSSVTGARKKAAGAASSADVVRVTIPPDESTVDEQAQLLFVNTAASRAYPHVHGWFNQHAAALTEASQGVVRNAVASEATVVPNTHARIVSSRQQLDDAKVVAASRGQQRNALYAYEHAIEESWLTAFQAAAQNYLDELSAIEAVLLDRRAKAMQWTQKGEQASVIARIARFEEKRQQLAQRSLREETQLAHVRQREQQRVKLALESCLVEIRDVVGWHTQKPHHHNNNNNTNSHSEAGGDVGGQELVLRRRQLVAMLGGAAAVKAYLERRALLPNEPGPRGSDARVDGGGSGSGGGGVTVTSILRHRDSETNAFTVWPPPSPSRSATVAPEQRAANWLWQLIRADEAREGEAATGQGPCAASGVVDPSGFKPTADEAALIAHTNALQRALRTHLSQQRQTRQPPQPPQQRGTAKQAAEIVRDDRPVKKESHSGSTRALPETSKVTSTDAAARGASARRPQTPEAAPPAQDADDAPSGQSRPDTHDAMADALSGLTASLGARGDERDGRDYTTDLLDALAVIDHHLQLPKVSHAVVSGPMPQTDGVVVAESHDTTGAAKDAREHVGSSAKTANGRAKRAAARPTRLTTLPDPNGRNQKTRTAVAAAAAQPAPASAASTAMVPSLPPLPPPRQARTGLTAAPVPHGRPAPGGSSALAFASTQPNPATTAASARLVPPALSSPSMEMTSRTATGPEVGVESLAQLVQMLQEEEASATQLVADKAQTSLALLRHLEALKASSAYILLENVALDGQRKALLARGRDTSSTTRVSGVVTEGGRGGEPVAWLVGPAPAPNSDADRVRAELTNVLQERQATLSQLQATVNALAVRVRQCDADRDAAALYWRRNAQVLRQADAGRLALQPAERSAVQGIPALGLDSGDAVAEFISSVF